ncbi:preprotein translocase subunit SecE [Conexibacter sp. SYSU D00693]|uniref:preprotein translocase subunit SecE n=1 Tax=Conexibacter sp. SYSU D00693 TaxID=2812560 RepID=UPI00196AA0AF|nr:preprotein translocase subunit SecE [Conexibacter sp. SYSU D00693]
MASDERTDREDDNPGPAPSEPHRENVPGELDHASAEVDQAEASIVRGADGVVADPSVPGGARSIDDLDDEDDEDGRQLDRSAAPGAPTTGGGLRVWNFFKACWAELQRVQWPDRRQVGQATAVVIGFVIVAGLYLGVADRLAQELVDLII